MTRILLLSDSHGYKGKLGTVLMKAESAGPFDAVIHLGDGYMDMKEYEQHLPPLYATPGNCDGDRGTVFLPQFGGQKVLITHGHAFHVKMGLHQLLARARQEEARIACFGHTHRPFCREENGVLLINPGSVMDGHFAVLTIDGGRVGGQLY